jgi:hypothetical protein
VNCHNHLPFIIAPEYATVALGQGRFHGPASLGTCPGLTQNLFFCLEKKNRKKYWKKGKMGKPAR